jgi:hypothetical protein
MTENSQHPGDLEEAAGRVIDQLNAPKRHFGELAEKAAAGDKEASERLKAEEGHIREHNARSARIIGKSMGRVL